MFQSKPDMHFLSIEVLEKKFETDIHKGIPFSEIDERKKIYKEAVLGKDYSRVVCLLLGFNSNFVN